MSELQEKKSRRNPQGQILYFFSVRAEFCGFILTKWDENDTDGKVVENSGKKISAD